MAVDHPLLNDLIFPSKQHFVSKLLEPDLDAQGLHSNAEVLVNHSCLPSPKCVLESQFLLKLEDPQQTFYCIITSYHKFSPLNQCFLLFPSPDLVQNCINSRQAPVIFSKYFGFLAEFTTPFLIEKCQLLFPIEKNRQCAIGF